MRLILCIVLQLLQTSYSLRLGPTLRRVVLAGLTSQLLTFSQPVLAFGPVEIPLKIVSYKEVTPLCNGQKVAMPGQKAMEGLFASCIEVEATVTNPSKDTLKDVSVYGFVRENTAGNSVLPNNPDFKSDAGQYAMIKTVAPGQSDVKFQFVVAIQQDTKKGEPLPPLEFMKQKAISFPGGDKFQPLTECEMDPRNCAEDDDE